MHMMTSSNGNISALLVICAENSPLTGEFPTQSQWRGALVFSLICDWIRVRSQVRLVRTSHGLLHFLLLTFQQQWSHGVHCGAVRPANRAKKVAADSLSKTAAVVAAAQTWFAKPPLDYMLHNTYPWKRCGRRSSMWPPYSLRRNLPQPHAAHVTVA